MPRPVAFHNRLAGSKVIVTGAGSLGDGVGTGKAIAALFAAEGARVALLDIDAGRAQATLALVREMGGDGFVVTGDAGDGDACARMVAESVAQLGGLDILVNNLGIATAGGPLHQVRPSDFDRVLSINLGSVFHMTRHAVPHLLQGNGKAIVNIASIAGIRAYGSAAYGPGKAAMLHLTAELAVMYGRDGIRANAVAPGHIFTPMVETHVVGENRRIRREIAPLPVEGDAWDIAQAALFLAGPESRFITGVTLPVDGGVTQIGPLAAFERLGGA